LIDCEVFSREIPVLVSAVSGRTELLPEHGPSDSPPGYPSSHSTSMRSAAIGPRIAIAHPVPDVFAAMSIGVQERFGVTAAARKSGFPVPPRISIARL
jgi:hypothetical protein